MAKPIKLTQELVQQMLLEFGKTLSEMKLSDGKVSFTKSLTYSDDDGAKATVLFEPTAYAKMLMLLDRFDSEVAWHGTVERLEDAVFVIKDILVYPQKVTGTTVNTDQERYQTWLMNLDDDTFNALHMQGHSHVNMTTTPSPTDLTHQESILAQCRDEDFYIFMIFNKSLKHTVKIFDLKSNILYENADIEIGIRDESGDLETFIEEAKRDVVTSVVSYATARNYGAKTANAKVSDADEPVKKNAGVQGRQNDQARPYPGYYGGLYDYAGPAVPQGDRKVDYDAEIFGGRYDW